MAQHIFTPTDNTHHRQSRFTTWLNEMFTELYTAWASMLASIGTNTSDISTLESTVGGHTTSISTLEGAYSANVNHTDIGEIGHVTESRTGAGLARVVLHFN